MINSGAVPIMKPYYTTTLVSSRDSRSSLSLAARSIIAALALAPLSLNAALTLIESGGTFRSDATNLAPAATAIGESEYGNPHFISNINDSLYGNNESWLGAVREFPGLESGNQTWVGVTFIEGTTIASFAFGRDNLGLLTDRASGSYTFQITSNAAVYSTPGAEIWTTVATLDRTAAAILNPALRHLYNLETAATGVLGFRIVTQAETMGSIGFFGPDEVEIFAPTGDGQAIDELEIYSTAAVPEPSTSLLIAAGMMAACAFTRKRMHGK